MIISRCAGAGNKYIGRSDKEQYPNKWMKQEDEQEQEQELKYLIKHGDEYYVQEQRCWSRNKIK